MNFELVKYINFFCICNKKPKKERNETMRKRQTLSSCDFVKRMRERNVMRTNTMMRVANSDSTLCINVNASKMYKRIKKRKKKRREIDKLENSLATFGGLKHESRSFKERMYYRASNVYKRIPETNPKKKKLENILDNLYLIINSINVEERKKEVEKRRKKKLLRGVRRRK